MQRRGLLLAPNASPADDERVLTISFLRALTTGVNFCSVVRSGEPAGTVATGIRRPALPQGSECEDCTADFKSRRNGFNSHTLHHFTELSSPEIVLNV